MKHTLVAGMILGLLALAHPLWAQTETPTQNIAEVVVTATRTEAGLDQVGGTSLSVITAADIEARQFHSLAQALRTVPGLQFSSTGGMGASSRVFMRGADTKNTLLLIDGIEVNDPADPNRGADLANISLDNVERIEVIRGPMSVLYGSNATAGVINIITRSGAGDVGGYVGGEAGTYSTTKGYAGVSGSGSKGGFSLAVSHLETDGYSLANADNNRIPHAGNTSEDDGWRNTNASGKVDIDISANTTLTAVARYTEAVMDEDEWGPGYAGDRFTTDPVTWAPKAAPHETKKGRQESERFLGKVELRNQLFEERFESVLDYKYARQKRESYAQDGFHAYDYTGTTDEWSWQGNLKLGSPHGVNFGVDYLNEKSDSSFDAKEDARTVSYWAQHQFIYAGFDVVSGVRYDEHEEFGGKTTWRIAPAYTFPRTGTLLRGVYATGFRAPSLYELYSQYGDTRLDPEQSTAWEFGVEQPLFDAKVEVGVTYFWMEFEDRIDWDSTRVIPGQAWPGGYAQMDGKSNTSGVEVFLALYPVDSFNIRLDYTYTDTEDVDGSRMERRPLNQVHVGLNYTPWRAVGLNVDAYWVDERQAIAAAQDINGAAVEVLDDYFLVNVAAHYDITDMLRIYARVDNLLDEHYEEAWSYATPGQSFYVGAKFTF
ncbi:MAG: TonB-dependent receptor [Desulfuromonadaceae bacterium]|nr:TonB-dependent receptor [Desulfuromonadaceae bacterium]